MTAVRNDVPAAMSADTQAAFSVDHVLPKVFAAPLVLHAGRQRAAAAAAYRCSSSGSSSRGSAAATGYVSHQNTHTHTAEGFESAARLPSMLWGPA